MVQYPHFIPENTAFPDSRRIGIYNAGGNRVGQIPLGSLRAPDMGQKQYTFGALSDVHVTYSTAADDLRTALAYLGGEAGAAFTCICGDLTDDGSEAQLAQYKALADTSQIPVYAISGNHEATGGMAVTTQRIQPYTGQPLYYSFTQGEDVFLMCGEYRWANELLFAEGELQWLYETLEAHRNQRCFVFFHVFPWGDCGNAGQLYTHDLFTGTPGEVLQSLLRHYKNTVFFHGHSHLKFGLQAIDDKANFSLALGYRSVHIPSLAVPRDQGDGVIKNIYTDSEGYVVDVYENGIHLRGRDFVKEKFLPIASYWLDTALVTVKAGTYKDPTGTIRM